MKKTIILLVILIASAVIRLTGIQWGLPNKFHTVTYHPDENTHLVKLQAMNPSKLNFNPVSERDPYALGEGTFFLYQYAATLKILSFIKYIKIVNNEEYYFNNINEWRKFFLVGRLLSVIYGVLTILVTFIVAKKMYGFRTGILAALFLGLAPVHVTYSQYLLMNVPGVLWIVLAFVFFKNILDSGKQKDYILGGVCIGFAISTLYSAGPLLLVLIVTHFLRKEIKELKKLVFGLTAMVFSFLIGTPYAILDYPNFIKGIKSPIAVAGISSANYSILPLYGSFLESFGIFLLILCLIGILYAIIKRKSEDYIILTWIFILLFFFIRAGVNAFPGRILPIVPFLIILGANLTNNIWNKKAVLGLFMTILILLTILPFSLALLKLRTEPDLRDVSSEWIENNITAGSSIGLLREPSWFSPGIVDRKYRHPEYLNLPNYKFILLNGDLPSYPGYIKLKKNLPDYLIISDVEINLLNEPGFLNKLKEKYHYENIENFDKSFSIFNIRVNRQIPEMIRVPNYISIFKKNKS